MSTPALGLDDVEVNEPITLDDERRRAAHEQLDEWLDACVVEAPKYYSGGFSGLLGELKIKVFVNSDAEIVLTQTRSVEREL